MRRIDFLVHLDDLMDTRMSTMLSLNVAKATNTIMAGYGRRRGDWVIWEGLGVTEEVWRKAYRTRTNEILMRSVRSKMVTFLMEIFNDLIKNPQISDNRNPFAVTINEYPYRLNNKAREGFESVLKLLTHPTLKVKWMRRAPKNLKPGYVAENHTHFFNYDMISWLEMHMEESGGTNFVTLQMIAPALFSEKPEDEDFAQFKGVLDGIHELGEYFTSPSMTIRFISPEYFNAPF